MGLDKNAIYVADVTYNILKRKGKTIIRETYKAAKIAAKGTDADLFKDPNFKRRLVFDFFRNEKANFPKVAAFPLENIEIKSIERLSFLSYGIK